MQQQVNTLKSFSITNHEPSEWTIFLISIHNLIKRCSVKIISFSGISINYIFIYRYFI